MILRDYLLGIPPRAGLLLLAGAGLLGSVTVDTLESPGRVLEFSLRDSTVLTASLEPSQVVSRSLSQQTILVANEAGGVTLTDVVRRGLVKTTEGEGQ